jgi:hypothetical protein
VNVRRTVSELPPVPRSGNALRATVAGSPDRSSKTGFAVQSNFPAMGISNTNEVMLTYWVYVPADFDWHQGGKLPGLGGCTTPPPTGFLMGTGGGSYDPSCWNGRLMFNRIPDGIDPTTGQPYNSGGVLSYFYVPFMRGKWMTPELAAAAGTPDAHRRTGPTNRETGLPRFVGATPAWNRNNDASQGKLTFKEGQWNRIDYYVKMNTPGVADGIHRGWLNGELGIDERDVVYRTADQPNQGANMLTTTYYFGGLEGPINDMPLWFDDMSIATP